MRIASALLAVCCCMSAASAQWLEKTIYLPDSLCAVPGPRHVVYNRANQTVYVGGDGLGVLAFGGSSGMRETVIETGVYADAMCCDPVLNKVYVGTWNGVVAIDGSGDTVCARLSVACYSPVLFSDTTRGKLYCADSMGTDLTVIDEVGDSVIRTVSVGNGATALCSDPTGNRVYCALAEDGAVAVLDAESDTLLCDIDVGSGPCALLGDSLRNRLYCANYGGRSVSVISVPDDSVIDTVTTGRYPRSLAYDPTRSRLYVACEYGEVTVIDCDADTVRAHVAVDAPWEVVFDSASDRAYCASRTDTVAVIDAGPDTMVKTLPVASGLCALALNPDANLVFCVSHDASKVTAIDASQDTVAAVELTGCRPDMICFSDVSRKLYVGYSLNDTSWLAVIDGATNRLLRTVPIPHYSPTACYNPGSDKVYMLDVYDSVLTAFNCATDTIVAEIRVPAGSSGAICCNPDDKVYCTNSEGHTVAVVSAQADSVVATIDFGSDVMLYAMCFDTTEDRLFVQGASAYTSTLFVIDGAADTVVGSCETFAYPNKMCYDPSTHILYDVDDVNPFCCLIDCHGAVPWQCGLLQLSGQASDVCRNSLNNDVYISGGFSVGWIWVIDTKQRQIVDSIYLSEVCFIEDIFHNPLSNRLYCAGDSVYVVDPENDSVLRRFPAASYNSDTLIAFNRDRNRVYVLSIEGSRVLVIADTLTAGLQDRVAKGGTQARRPQSIVRGALFLPKSASSSPSTSCLLDISGRKVLDLKPGANDVRALAPGVYFVREAQAHPVRKVVITK